MKKVIILLIGVTSTFATFAQTGKSKMSQSKTDTTVQVKYACPMHTDVISDKAGKYPKCGMDLVEKKNPVKTKSKSKKSGSCCG